MEKGEEVCGRRENEVRASEGAARELRLLRRGPGLAWVQDSGEHERLDYSNITNTFITRVPRERKRRGGGGRRVTDRVWGGMDPRWFLGEVDRQEQHTRRSRSRLFAFWEILLAFSKLTFFFLDLPMCG